MLTLAIGANFGLDWDYFFSDYLNIKADLDLLFIPEENPFFEHKLILKYTKVYENTPKKTRNVKHISK